jgi:hypothetical protein
LRSSYSYYCRRYTNYCTCCSSSYFNKYVLVVVVLIVVVATVDISVVSLFLYSFVSSGSAVVQVRVVVYIFQLEIALFPLFFCILLTASTSTNLQPHADPWVRVLNASAKKQTSCASSETTTVYKYYSLTLQLQLFTPLSEWELLYRIPPFPQLISKKKKFLAACRLQIPNDQSPFPLDS